MLLPRSAIFCFTSGESMAAIMSRASFSTSGSEVLRSAGNLADIFGLRGIVSIHLASALWLKARVSETVDFAVFDQRLGAAASKAGLSVVP